MNNKWPLIAKTTISLFLEQSKYWQNVYSSKLGEFHLLSKWQDLAPILRLDNPHVQQAHRKLEQSLDIITTRIHQSYNKNQLKLRKYLQDRTHLLSTCLNEVTGYESIERLRKQVQERDESYLATRQEVKELQQQYENRIKSRLKGQKQLSDLLQRKPSWQEEDVLVFAEGMREELIQEQNEEKLKGQVSDKNGLLDARHGQLMDSLRERYQVEQMWSDKIRYLSTMATMFLMLFNISIFLCVQFFWEPRKRMSFLQDLETRVPALINRMLLTGTAPFSPPASGPAPAQPSPEKGDLMAVQLQQIEDKLDQSVDQLRTKLNALLLQAPTNDAPFIGSDWTLITRPLLNGVSVGIFASTLLFHIAYR